MTTTRVQPAVGQDRLAEHRRDARAVGDVAREADRRPAVADPRPRDTDALAVAGHDLPRRLRRGRRLAVHAHDVGALLHQAVGGRLPDARAGAHDRDDPPVELLLGRQAPQLRLLERPVLDVEGLLRVHGLVAVDGLRPPHDLDRAVVELGRHPRLALVLAPGDHPQPRDEHDGRVGIAHRRRSRPLAALVVRRVVAAVLHEARAEDRLQRFDVAGLRVPVGEERLDLGPQEVVGAGRAELRETRAVDAVDEAQHLRVVLHRAHEAPLDGDLAPEPREDLGQEAPPLVVREGRVPLPAEGPLAPVARLDVRRGPVDDLERGLVAGLVVVAPRAHAVVAEEDALRPGVRLDQRLHPEADVEARPLPGDVEDLVPVHLAAEPLLVHGRGDRDHRVRVQVVHVPEGDEGVQGRVDRARARVQVEHAVAVELVHLVLDLRLRTALLARQVARLHRPHPIGIERGEAVALHRAQVAARALHPQDLDALAGEGVFLRELRRGVAAPGVREGQVGAEGVGPVDEAVDTAQPTGLLVSPAGLQVAQPPFLDAHAIPP